jgi:hypothetical protein
MKHLDRETRRTGKRLKEMIEHVRNVLAAGSLIERAHCDELRALAGEYDQLVILRGGATGASKLMADAAALIERCDPLASLRAIKLDYIDRLATACDALMTAGQTPQAHYLSALGTAVGDFESEHSCGEDAHLLAFAWDILAQAEAGLGEATNEADYEQAEQRYRRVRRAPALTLVTAS